MAESKGHAFVVASDLYIAVTEGLEGAVDRVFELVIALGRYKATQTLVAADSMNRVYLLGNENTSIRWQDSLSIVTGDTNASSIFARMEGLIVDLTN